MGFHVSQLRSVPIDKYEYYVYFVDAAPLAGHSAELAESLLRLAIKSGTNAAIVSGPRSLSVDLTQFLQKHAPSEFVRLETLFSQVSCLLISRGALQTTTTQVFVIPLATGDKDARSQKLLVDEIMSPLIKSMHEDKVADFCRSLGAQEMALSNLKDGILVARLRHLNQVLELKPNVAGLGVNLNAVLERLLGPAQRT